MKRKNKKLSKINVIDKVNNSVIFCTLIQIFYRREGGLFF